MTKSGAQDLMIVVSPRSHVVSDMGDVGILYHTTVTMINMRGRIIMPDFECDIGKDLGIDESHFSK